MHHRGNTYAILKSLPRGLPPDKQKRELPFRVWDYSPADPPAGGGAGMRLYGKPHFEFAPAGTVKLETTASIYKVYI